MSEDILIVEDEERYRTLMEMMLSDLERPIRTAANGREGLEAVRERAPAIVLTDLRMPEMEGAELLDAMRSEHPDVPIIVITAFGSIESAVNAMRAGAFDYVTKPFEEEALKLSVQRALEMSSLRRQNRRLREEIEERFDFNAIIGQSPGILRTIDLCGQVAKTETTVLILGESGTGKELVARAIHYNSKRSEGPFVAINCAAIPEGLLESELFGSERGAYTGSVDRKVGSVEQATGGTLFLDEIGDMDLALQAKLLRVIQEREFRRLGGTKALSADVRILCATNQNLDQRVQAGNFRRDLYYRINVFPIELPPLRERGEDVLLLARHFLERFQKEMGKRISGFSRAAEEWLLRQRWEGNIRELENVIERAVILCRDEIITPAVLRPMGSGLASENDAGPVSWSLPADGINLEELEKDMVRQALEQAKFNKTRAAKLLGLTRATLRYRIEKYGLG